METVDIDKYYSGPMTEMYETAAGQMARRFVGVLAPGNRVENGGLLSADTFNRSFAHNTQGRGISYESYLQVYSPAAVKYEEWRYCPGISRRYQVSSLGRVRYKRSTKLHTQKLVIPVGIPFGRYAKRTGWKAVKVQDHYWDLASPTIQISSKGNIRDISYRCLVSKESTAADLGVCGDYIFGGINGSLSGAWGRAYVGKGGAELCREHNRFSSYFQKASFLTLCAFTLEGNKPWNEFLQNRDYPAKMSIAADEFIKKHGRIWTSLEREEWKEGEFTGWFEPGKRVRVFPFFLDLDRWDCRVQNLKWIPNYLQAPETCDAQMRIRGSSRYYSSGQKTAAYELLEERALGRGDGAGMLLQEVADKTELSLDVVKTISSEVNVKFAEQIHVRKVEEEADKRSAAEKSKKEDIYLFGAKAPSLDSIDSNVLIQSKAAGRLSSRPGHIVYANERIFLDYLKELQQEGLSAEQIRAKLIETHDVHIPVRTAASRSGLATAPGGTLSVGQELEIESRVRGIKDWLIRLEIREAQNVSRSTVQ